MCQFIFLLQYIHNQIFPMLALNQSCFAFQDAKGISKDLEKNKKGWKKKNNYECNILDNVIFVFFLDTRF